MHALANIELNKAKPLTKATIPSETYDDRTVGKLFAAEVTGLVMAQAVSWGDLARRLLGMTIEARKVAIEALTKWKKDLKEGIIELHGMDDRRATKFINSSVVQVSNMTTIARAMNAGMDEAMLRDAWKFSDGIENLGFNCFCRTARDVVSADANRGRKPEALLVKLNKWVKLQKEGADKFTAEDRRLMDDIIKFLADHAE